MAASSRCAMRILSPRWHSLRQLHPSPAFRQIRGVSSRYSNPSQRGFAGGAAPKNPTFLNSETVSSDAIEGEPAPIDPQKAQLEMRQYYIRRMRFAGMGLLMSFAGMAMILYNLDLDDMELAEKRKREKGQQMDASNEASEKFQGKDVQIIGAGEGKRILAQGKRGEEIELVETGTSHVPHFPRTIFLPSGPVEGDRVGVVQPGMPGNEGNIGNQEEYTLVGLGIRTVMWIQVYVVGMYIRTKDVSALQEKLIHRVNSAASTLVPYEKDELKKRLLDPAESREIWAELLKTPGIKTAWRVSPTRNTDFGHLRDGFVTGMNKRVQEARQLTGTDTEYDGEDFGQSIQGFKGIFSAGKAPKGSVLLMTRDRDGRLDVLFQPKTDGEGEVKEMEKLGSVPDERISRLIWFGYLAGDKVSSEPTRQGVVDGCVSFAGRPVGSVETMVT